MRKWSVVIWYQFYDVYDLEWHNWPMTIMTKCNVVRKKRVLWHNY